MTGQKAISQQDKLKLVLISHIKGLLDNYAIVLVDNNGNRMQIEESMLMELNAAELLELGHTALDDIAHNFQVEE